MGSATRHYANALEASREALREQGRADFDAMNARHATQCGPYTIKNWDWVLLEKDRKAFASINANFGAPVKTLGERARMVAYDGGI